MSLKTLLIEVGEKLLRGHSIQQFASITIAIGIACQLYGYFENLLTKTHENFNSLKSLAFSDYLMAYMSLAALPEAITIIVSALAFAITWRITYDLKPKSKV
ncbi:DUF2523 family protein [Acinetobacter wuhouensis]|uniref:DUF2523 domain-containing protein n=1 Tax=Acinetobacter wuhouensis TaxID=1879050 RepID=A0A4Q7ABS2_9GAMM|nr:DUF2523 family protein [Acinetobacter wuhouensis]RZG42852.1 DUF2523 domain-containing protein [Acinetobacter wuhouensis]